MSFLGRRLRTSLGAKRSWRAPLDTSIWDPIVTDTGTLAVSGEKFVWNAGNIAVGSFESMIYELVVGPDDIDILQNQDYDLKFGVIRTMNQNPAAGTGSANAGITIRGLRNLDKTGPIDSLTGTSPSALFEATSTSSPASVKSQYITTTVTTGPEFVGFLLRISCSANSTDGHTIEAFFDMLNDFTIEVSPP